MKSKKIDTTLKMLRVKLWVEGLINTLINFLLIAAIVTMAIALMSHGFPVVHFLEKVSKLCLGNLMFGGLIGIVRRPDLKTVAKTGDKLGLFDRLTTYVEYRERDGDIFQLFQGEVEDFLEYINPAKKYRLKVLWKRAVIALLVFIVGVGISFIPTVKTNLARERENINRELKEEAKKLWRDSQEISEELNAAESGSEKYCDLKKMYSVLEELKKELEQTFDYGEAYSQVNQAHGELANTLSDRNLISTSREDFNSLGSNTRKQGAKEGGIKTGAAYQQSRNSSSKSDNVPMENSDSAETKKKVEAKLSSLEERLMEKGGMALDMGKGDKASDSISKDGKTKGKARETELSSDELKLGDIGAEDRKKATGKGGGTVGQDYYAKKERPQIGIEKESPSRLHSDTVEVTGAAGQEKRDKGILSQKPTDKVLEFYGDRGKDTLYYAEYDKDTMDHVPRHEISLEYKPLIKEYFKRMSEGN